MSSAPVLDLDDLTGPIAGDLPAGEDLRQDLSPTPVYYQIRDVRTAARAAERQGTFDDVIGSAEASEWRPILDLARGVLRERSKDLEVVAWLIEALTRTHGFAGLRDGLRLALRLVENYWDGIYPRPDEDGLETTLAPLVGLNGAGAEGTLASPIARVSITAASSEGPFAAWSLVQAQELERLSADARQERIEAGAVSMDQLNVAVHETPPEFFADLVADLEGCLSAWADLGSALDERCGAQSPPTSSVRSALNDALDAVRLVARDVLPAPVGDAGEDAVAEVAGAGGGAGAPGAGSASAPASSGEIQTREDAFRALTRVADYFRRSEPHSPISFLVERTVRWGRLPLPELLAELIPDESARGTYEQLTGVAGRAREE